MRRRARVLGAILTFVLFCVLIASAAHDADGHSNRPHSAPVLLLLPFSPLPGPTVTSGSVPPVPARPGSLSDPPTVALELSSSTPTPVPDRGVRLTAVREIALEQGEGTPGDLYPAGLDGDTLVAGVDTDAGHALVSIDLETGSISQLPIVSNAGIQQLKASGGKVAWIEPAPDSASSTSRLHVLDLATGLSSIVAEGDLYQVDLKDDIIAWQGLREQGWGVYALDLKSGSHYVIAEGSGIKSFPSVCNREWVVYLDTGQASASSAKLRAHRLSFDQDVDLGWVPLPKYGSAGQQHACDRNRVAWIGWQSEDTPVDESQPVGLHLFELATGSVRTLDLPGVFPAAEVQISGDIVLVGSAAYDLQTDVPFEVNSAPWPPGGYTRALHVSSDRLVLLYSGMSGGPQCLYAGVIARDPTGRSEG